jgi:peroxiredoxin
LVNFEFIQWILLLLAFCLIFLLFRQYAIEHLQGAPDISRAGPRIGQRIEHISVVDMSGKELKLDLKARGDTLLVFIGVDCPACDKHMRNFAAAVREGVTGYHSRVLVGGPLPGENRRFAARHERGEPLVVYTDPENRNHQKYNISVVPFGVYLREGKVVNKGVVTSLEQIRWVMQDPKKPSVVLGDAGTGSVKGNGASRRP